MGTDTLDDCPATATANDEPLDAWPPDFNDDQVADVFDVNILKLAFFTGVGDPDYDPRLDLDTDGFIDIFDVGILNGHFFTSCVSTASQVIDVIKATEQYRDVQVALDDGFDPVSQPLPGRGSYFINPDRWDDTLDLLEPEGLIYEPAEDDWRLAGVFYLTPVWIEAEPPEGFLGSDDVWSVHDEFCIDENLRATEGTSEQDCGALGGVWWEEMGHFLSAWLFRFNPDGVFQEENPTVVP